MKGEHIGGHTEDNHNIRTTEEKIHSYIFVELLYLIFASLHSPQYINCVVWKGEGEVNTL
jgi:hypothetical protein